MKLSLGVMLIAFAAFPIGGAATGTTAPLQPYEILVHGTVRSVDLHHGTIVLAYAPLETAPAGVRSCVVVERPALVRLRSGERIEAYADTRHARWILRGIHEAL